MTKVLPTGDGSKNGIRSPEFMKEHDLDFKLGVKVENVDTRRKQIILKSGEELSYDKLCIATGGRPKPLQVPGSDANNVFMIRSAKDQLAIKEAAASKKNIVVLGGSFIASESAASLKFKYKDETQVHLVTRQENPMETVLGKEVSSILKAEHEKNGVQIHSKSSIKEIKKDGSGNVSAVVLENG